MRRPVRACDPSRLLRRRRRIVRCNDYRRERKRSDQPYVRRATDGCSRTAQATVIDLTWSVEAGDARLTLVARVHDVAAEMLHAAPNETGAQIDVCGNGRVARGAGLVNVRLATSRNVEDPEVLEERRSTRKLTHVAARQHVLIRTRLDDDPAGARPEAKIGLEVDADLASLLLGDHIDRDLAPRWNAIVVPVARSVLGRG